MLGPLPEFVDPFRLARRRARIGGAVPIAEMSRVGALVRDDSGVAEVVLRFRMSASGTPRVDGRVRLTARLTCQRCLDPLDLELAPEPRAAFTDGDEAAGRAELAAGYEPLECGGRIGLKTWIEDEILLALPDFPMHLPDMCGFAGEIGVKGPEASPFAGLRALLRPSRT